MLDSPEKGYSGLQTRPRPLQHSPNKVTNLPWDALPETLLVALA